MSSTILRLACPDRVALLAQLSGFFAQHGGNLLEVHQFTDSGAGWFFARMAIETRTLRLGLPALRTAFTPLAGELEADWTLREAQSRMRVILMVSKLGHCLADLLWRWRSGELEFDIPLVISNHEDFRKVVEREGLEFRHMPMTTESKAEVFAEIAGTFRDVRPDLIVLARYMQIIPAEICAEFKGRILNIHHSFLPSFVGANPYQRAYERGVKLIGATCHYATAELDAGPIIDQEVIRVEHFHTPDDLVRLGRDCERLALARSVRWHLDDRVLVHGNRAIVFRD
ncbi:MAG TPA: formyltetrahydrofolate deformylase [Chthoniobacteraceae bacterium]|nr:formyltetrahydrofolate deformylase [Chthoniobacteraceae bacterium]